MYLPELSSGKLEVLCLTLATVEEYLDPFATKPIMPTGYENQALYLTHRSDGSATHICR